MSVPSHAQKGCALDLSLAGSSVTITHNFIHSPITKPCSPTRAGSSHHRASQDTCHEKLQLLTISNKPETLSVYAFPCNNSYPFIKSYAGRQNVQNANNHPPLICDVNNLCEERIKQRGNSFQSAAEREKTNQVLQQCSENNEHKAPFSLDIHVHSNPKLSAETQQITTDDTSDDKIHVGKDLSQSIESISSNSTNKSFCSDARWHSSWSRSDSSNDKLTRQNVPYTPVPLQQAVPQPNQHSINKKKRKKKKKSKSKTLSASSLEKKSASSERQVNNQELLGYQKMKDNNPKSMPIQAICQQMKVLSSSPKHSSPVKILKPKLSNSMQFRSLTRVKPAVHSSYSKSVSRDVNCTDWGYPLSHRGTDNPLSMSYSSGREMVRVTKVYQSERQSGVLKEMGLEIPCAPPATPMPALNQLYEYIPCMNDIRSQRAVKVQLEALERAEKQKQERAKEEKLKQEKLQQKEKEREERKQQRLEIYALNKVMTDLEHKNFKEFCHKNGLSFKL